jgi:hypothetical protein
LSLSGRRWTEMLGGKRRVLQALILLTPFWRTFSFTYRRSETFQRISTYISDTLKHFSLNERRWLGDCSISVWGRGARDRIHNMLMEISVSRDTLVVTKEPTGTESWLHPYNRYYSKKVNTITFLV